MATIKILHWNMETYGKKKFINGNNANFISYVAKMIFNLNVNIFTIVEVKNAISGSVPGLIIADVNALYGIKNANNPWQYIRINAVKNYESYIIIFRKDQNFLPANSTGTVTNVALQTQGLGREDYNGNPLEFPSAYTSKCGRRPFYGVFRTTDTKQFFSVISYHAMFSKLKGLISYGIIRLPSLNYVYEFDDGPPATPIQECLIAGDFNVDFKTNFSDYKNVLALPTTQATSDKTTLMDNPLGGNVPGNYLASAYDNIFQSIIVTAPAGQVVDLMVQSSIIPGGPPAPPPPPAVQPGAGPLSAEAGAFNPNLIPNKRALNKVTKVPPVSMPTAWAFVRETISNHYPVYSIAKI